MNKLRMIHVSQLCECIAINNELLADAGTLTPPRLVIVNSGDQEFQLDAVLRASSPLLNAQSGNHHRHHHHHHHHLLREHSPSSESGDVMRHFSPLLVTPISAPIPARSPLPPPSPKPYSLFERDHSFDSDTTIGSDMFGSSDEATIRKPSKESNIGASKWARAKKLVTLMLYFRRKKYPWVQLAGHHDGFKIPTENSSWICKKGSKYEKLALSELMQDPLKPFVPEYGGTVVENDIEYLQMSNLMSWFDTPNIMDCKMGCRTYLESEVDTVTLRKDLLAKMVQIDPNEPSEEEKAHGIHKLRYMKFRDDVTSSSSLKFRIDACKTRDEHAFSLKSLNERGEIRRLFKSYLHNDVSITKALHSVLARLKSLRETLIRSPFFKHHEVIGSSLLFACDVQGNTGVWMIDFAKTINREREILHTVPWIPSSGSFEDEYLIGLDHVIAIFEEIGAEL